VGRMVSPLALLASINRKYVVEQDHRPVAVIKPSQPAGPGRKLSECIALAEAYERKLGYAPLPDHAFARDVQAAIDERRDPIDPPSWD